MSQSSMVRAPMNFDFAGVQKPHKQERMPAGWSQSPFTDPR